MGPAPKREAWRPNVEKLLVTRVDSLIGANAVAVMSDRIEVIGAAAPVISSRAPAERAADFADSLVETTLRDRPNIVLHSGSTSWSSWDGVGIAGVRSPSRDELPDDGESLLALASACREVQARLVVVTSDAVFCGPRMFHEEGGRSFARTTAAKRQAAWETTLCEAGALVLRTHVYGWMPDGGVSNYAERMVHALTAELPCRVDARRHATPILATDFVGLALEACRAGLTGLYHLTGAERTSPFRFAAELAATLGVPGCNVRLDAVEDKNATFRSDETSLNVTAIRRRLQRPLPLLREGLTRFAQQAFNGYRDRFRRPIASSTSAEATNLQAA